MALVCAVATTDNLDASYSVINQNPTLTLNSTGTLTIDGRDILVGDVILVKDQIFLEQNAVYQCYVRGDTGVAAVLVLYYNFSTPTKINNCGIINVIFGDTNQNSSWVINAIITVIGVDQIEFIDFVNQSGSTNITTLGTITTGTWDAGSVTTDSFLEIPTTSGTLVGTIMQNGIPILHNFGGDNNLFLGRNCANFVAVVGDYNFSLGNSCFTQLLSGNNNIAIGKQALSVLQNGNGNIVISNGSSSIDSLVSGNLNLLINGGGNYSGSESNNVIIANLGEPGDSNKIRIGTYGTSDYQQDVCYIDPPLTANNGLNTEQITFTGDVLENSIIIPANLPSLSSERETPEFELSAFDITDGINFYYSISTTTERPQNTFRSLSNFEAVITAQQFISIAPNEYSTLDDSSTASQSGTIVTGIGTTFPTTCAGGNIFWPGINRYATITQYNSATSLTVSPSQSISAGPFVIYYEGINIDALGIRQLNNQTLQTNNIDTPTNGIGTTLALGATNATSITLRGHEISLSGNFTTSGAFNSTFTMTADTNVTFPTSGTLATTSSLPTLPLSLSNGGTNANLTASNGGIFYSSASAGAILAGTATATKMLQSGATAAPAWSTTTWPATSTINQILYSSAANVISGLSTANSSVLITSSGGVPSLSTTLPSGLAATNLALTTPSLGTPTSGTLSSCTGLSLTTGVTGLLPLANGGMNASLTASNGGIFYSTASAGAILSGTAIASQLLLSGATAAPTWSTTTYPSTNSINTLLYASSANVMAALATGNNGVLITSSGGVPSISSTLPSAVQTNITSLGTISTGVWNATVVGATYGGTGVNNGANTITLAGNLVTSGANSLTLTTTGPTNVTFPTSGTLATTGGTVSSVTGTSNRITSSGGTTPAIDISASYVGQSSITTLGTIGTGTWQGTAVGATYGGTGVNNGASTITLGGNLTLSGAFTTTLTVTATTSVTLPTSGTLATTQGLPMTVVSGTTQAASVNNSYISNNAGLCTITIPSTAAVGDSIEVGGLGAGGWKIAQNASQLIHLGSTVTTTGTGGSLASTNQYDSITIRCVVANTTWITFSSIGNITVV